MNYTLTYCFALIIFTGCMSEKQEPTQEIEPENGCLIATQTTKELVSSNQKSQFDLETIIINGESFQIGTVKKSAYTYDRQGRIESEYNQYISNELASTNQAYADSVLYYYTASKVHIQTISFFASGKRERTDSVELNKQGLAERRPFGLKATYDYSGYLLSLVDEEYGITATINNGNIIENEIAGHDATPSHTYKYTYDFNKNGLPPIRTFYGKPSRNLSTGYSIQRNGPFATYPNEYQEISTYVFNEVGLVKRQLSTGKHAATAYMIYGSPIKVIDFTYTCPQ